MRRFVADVAHFLFSAVGLQPVVTRVVAMNSGGWRYNVRKRDPVDTHAGKLQEEDVYRTHGRTRHVQSSNRPRRRIHIHVSQ